MHMFRTTFKALLLLSLSLVMSACGSGDSDSGGGDMTMTDPTMIEPNLMATVVGPNLNGDTWAGYLKSITGAFTPMTAVIRHVGTSITIDTSLEGEVGDSLSGTISASGMLNLIDRFDGEDWTTLFGPASANSINIADFVFVGGQRIDTNIIILKR